jgi:hypothetical protein
MTLAYMSVPDAYGVVESGVYRSKALDLHNLPFLLHLQLRTILYLSPDPLAKAVTDFLDSNKIKLVCGCLISLVQVFFCLGSLGPASLFFE